MNMTVWRYRNRLRREMWVWRAVGALTACGTLAAASVEWWPVVMVNAVCLFGCLRFHRETRERLDSVRWKTGGMDR